MKNTFHELGVMATALVAGFVIVIIILIGSLAALGTKVSSANGVNRSYTPVQTGDLSEANISILYGAVYGLEITTTNYYNTANPVTIRAFAYPPCINASVDGKDICSY